MSCELAACVDLWFLICCVGRGARPHRLLRLKCCVGRGAQPCRLLLEIDRLSVKAHCLHR
eukprot:13243763-Alexandrium_andersonii.AAC.1